MDFNCYIDESGDEGIQTGGSRWFILGALIVPSNCDLQVSTMVSRIKRRFGREEKTVLHWSRIRSHDKRLFICRELLSESWQYACVAIDKTHPTVIGTKGLRQKSHLYFYAAHLLLEQLSRYARDVGRGGRAYLTFENRSNLSYSALHAYLKLIDAQYPTGNIFWPNLAWDSLRVLSKSESRLLQASDSIVGALGSALEYTTLGNIEPRYILMIKDRLYRRGGKLFGYGLKFLMPGRQEGYMKSLKEEYGWLSEI